MTIIYMDMYVKNTPSVQIEIYQLIGIVALMLAVKMQEDVVLTQEQANMECQNQYNIQMMEAVEHDMFKKLNYFKLIKKLASWTHCTR